MKGYRYLILTALLILIAVPVLAESNIVTIPMDGNLRVAQIDYGYNVTLAQYSLNPNVALPSDNSWEILGSNNGLDYSLIETQSGIILPTGIETTFPSTNLTPFRYFQFTMTRGFYNNGLLDLNLTTTQTSGGTPASDFYATSPITVLGNPTGFVDSSTNAPVGWYWMFGDGSTSTVQNPYHTYSGYGYYSVNHSSTNVNGLSSWNNKTNYILIVPPGPLIIPSFTGTPTSGLASLPVAFTDTSLSFPTAVTAWSWTFGDGGTSALQNPSHTYNTPGTYSVTLTASNANVTNSTTYANYITVTAPLPSTAFVKSFSSDATTTSININRYHYGPLAFTNPDTGAPIVVSQTISYLPDSTTLDVIPIQPAIKFYGDDGSEWIYRTV